MQGEAGDSSTAGNTDTVGVCERVHIITLSLTPGIEQCTRLLIWLSEARFIIPISSVLFGDIVCRKAQRQPFIGEGSLDFELEGRDGG